MSDNNFVKTVSERRNSEIFNTHTLSPAYINFTENNKKFWIVLNLTMLCIYSVVGFMSRRILTMYPNECAGLKMACYALLILYIINFFFSLMALFGLEKKLCNTCWLTIFIVFDGVILFFAQNTYFKSQMTNCMATVPQLYFWLMSQIMLVYVLAVFMICWLFRKHCQDPNMEEVENDQEAQFEKNIEKKADIEMGIVETREAEVPKAQEIVPAAEKGATPDLKIDVSVKKANETST